ncbi:hypothetical protein Cme02nite_58730 [Catellatospora methionotrophica]|uniref:Uncharacterized protein n=1 Tax=Catellatospora methionotrophica TaxID=121620 RepID=A0A8J3LLP1_9ACTN|nr:PD40 domain-containing protein [Catellatospora methionotrophica]GIG17541.1 hypothetical protein Cme02nite_58730 [Catellatospora methionotrophica]
MRKLAVALCLAGAAVLMPAAPAAAVVPGTPGDVAFIRGGNLFVAEPGGTVWQATTGGGYEWPRWRSHSADLAVLKDGNLWVGSYSTSDHAFHATQQITSGAVVGAAAWSPDGNRLAYAQGSFAPSVYIVDFGPVAPSARGLTAAQPVRVDTRLSPQAQRIADRLPKKTQRAAAAAAPTTWHAARNSLAVAWSPDGRYIAYPNGECFAVFDDCLGMIDLTTGNEVWVAAFGGGGATEDGFATIPAFTADSTRIMWTQQTRPRYEADPQISYIKTMSALVADPFGSQSQVGAAGEYSAVPSPAGGTTVLVTSGRSGVAWVARRAGSTRTWLYQGYQHDWQSLP